MTTTRTSADRINRRATARTVTAFAGIMLLTTAVLQILEGVAAVAEDEVFVTGINYAYEFDVTTWGWVHVGLGALGAATAIGILMNQMWSQFAGLVFATMGAVLSFLFLPYFPLWALVVIAFDVVVIWALSNELERPAHR